jgi:pyridoxal phosphate enzyme (YggS family)
MLSMTAASTRRDELHSNLDAVRSRIELACAAAGRDPGELTVIAVTKFFPASDAALLADLGVADLGENRDQDAAVKVEQVRTLTAALVRWHFVGRLQTNKARSVARYADLVHSVDRPSLLPALEEGARRSGRERLRILIQISLDEAEGRGGVQAANAIELARIAADHSHLDVAGVMAIAPLGADPDPAFAALAEVSARLREVRASASLISAGMSGDLEAAIRHGATHLRIGTALLGRRDPTFG